MMKGAAGRKEAKTRLRREVRSPTNTMWTLIRELAGTNKKLTLTKQNGPCPGNLVDYRSACEPLNRTGCRNDYRPSQVAGDQNEQDLEATNDIPGRRV